MLLFVFVLLSLPVVFPVVVVVSILDGVVRVKSDGCFVVSISIFFVFAVDDVPNNGINLFLLFLLPFRWWW